MTDNDVLIRWPKWFTPLPEGYEVFWVDCVEHYMGFAPGDEDESPVFASKFRARSWCFAHYKKANP